MGVDDDHSKQDGAGDHGGISGHGLEGFESGGHQEPHRTRMAEPSKASATNQNSGVAIFNPTAESAGQEGNRVGSDPGTDNEPGQL